MTGLPGLEDLTVFRIEVAEGVATVFMDRAPVNAQNGVFRDEVMRVFDVLHDSDEVRAIVLTGAGKTFSAGADLRDRPDVSKRGAYPRHSRAVRGGFDCVMECAKPVIAAVNGAAIGAGCVLALVCDIVLVAEPRDDRGGCPVLLMTEIGHGDRTKMSLTVEQVHDKISSDPSGRKADLRAPFTCAEKNGFHVRSPDPGHRRNRLCSMSNRSSALPTVWSTTSMMVFGMW